MAAAAKLMTPVPWYVTTIPMVNAAYTEPRLSPRKKKRMYWLTFGASLLR